MPLILENIVGSKEISNIYPVQSDSIFLIRINPLETTTEEAQGLLKTISSLYPNNTCVVIPNNVSFETCSLDSIIQIRDSLNEIIEERENI